MKKRERKIPVLRNRQITQQRAFALLALPLTESISPTALAHLSGPDSEFVRMFLHVLVRDSHSALVEKHFGPVHDVNAVVVPGEHVVVQVDVFPNRVADAP